MMAHAYYVIIMCNFLMTGDATYEELPYIDRIRYYQIFVRIIFLFFKSAIFIHLYTLFDNS